jgi:putative tRNA adenosine deaminase-associated protein
LLVTHVATVLVRTGDDWTAHELDLRGMEDVDSVADAVRDAVAGDGPAVMFVEEDDEYFVALRLDDADADPRIFLSDVRAVDTSELAAMLYGEGEEDADLDEEDDEDAPPLDVEPGGDDTVFADLGTAASELRALCTAKGMLPSDVIAALCERAGCGEAWEDLRLA